MKTIKTRKDLQLAPLSSLNVAHSRPIVFRSADICARVSGLLWDFRPNPKWVRMDGELKCSCVFACPIFSTYPVNDKSGVRKIPHGAKCPYIDGPCRGAHWFVRGTSAKDSGHYVEYTDSKNKPVEPWYLIEDFVAQDAWIRQQRRKQK